MADEVKAPTSCLGKPSTVDADYWVPEQNVLMLNKLCKDSEVRGAKAESQNDPFKHSVCNRYYWKVTAVVYLVVCVLLAVIYVAIYAEQHGYYGSYYDNLENLGKPLHPTDGAGLWTNFKDLPYTEWLSRRFPLKGHPIDTWTVLPQSLSSVHQVVGYSLEDTLGVWAVTDNSLFYVDVSGEDGVEPRDVGKSLNLSIGASSWLAIGAGGDMFVVDSHSITRLNCSTLNGCVAVHSQDRFALGTVSSVLVANGEALWIGSDQGLFLSLLTSTEVEPPKKILHVSGPVYSMAWRSSYTVLHSETLEGEDITCVSLEECHALLEQLLVGGGSPPRCHLETLPFITNSSLLPVKANLSISSSNGYFPGNDTLSNLLAQFINPSPDICHHSNPWLFSTGDPNNHTGVLAVGARGKVHFFDGEQWWFEWVSQWGDGLGGVVDGPVTSMTFVPSGELYLGTNISLSRLNSDYTFDRFGPEQGLPYNQITSLAFLPYSTLYPDPFGRNLSNKTSGSVVMTTEEGMTTFDITTSSFMSYFHGYRWLPGNNITLVTSVSESSFVAVTDGGWALIRGEDWTLQQKSAHYLSMLPRHTRPPGIVSDCPLVNYDLKTCAPQTTDNDGLWTSWLVASEAFRYKVEGNKTASWGLYEGLHFLNTVTGIQGLMGRSVVHVNSTVCGGVWHNSSTQPEWKWKGDTSSDEVVGHMFAYPIVYDLVATTTEEKKEVKNLIDTIVGYIKNNRYYLIDVNGQPTRWGVWSPQQLNWNYSWSDERGVNSLQILSYLVSAYRVTAKREYLEAWQTLFNGSIEGTANHYGLNMINQKITFPRDDNFSDDELAFLPYFTYFYNLKMLEEKDILLANDLVGTARASLERTWKYVRSGRSSAWSAIYCFCSESCDNKTVENLVWNLRTWPLELIEWPVKNSHRLDIYFNKEQDRDFHSKSQSLRVLPANERGQLRWNGNPFQLDFAGSSSEMDPGPWLLPYWMSRWSKVL